MESKTHLIRSFNSPPVVVTPEEFSGSWQENSQAQHYRGDAEVRLRTLLRRHGGAIGWIVFACLLVGAIVTFFMRPSYKAKTLVEVLAVNQDFLNNKDIDPNASASTMDTYLETQTKLLTSDTVADRVVASLTSKEARYNEERGGGMATVRRWLGLPPVPTDSAETEIRNALSNLKVKAEGQSSLISITIIGATPHLAADTANAVAEQHIAALQDARWKTASETGEFLSAQLDSQRKKLQASDEELQNYARKTGLIYSSESGRDSIAAEKLREIQGDLAKAESDRADKQAQLELINSSSADALPKVLDSTALHEDKSHLMDLRRQLADLSATLMPDHYKVRQVQAEIDAVEKQIAQERSTIVARIENDYRAAQRREEIQKRAYNQQLALVSDQSGKAVRYKMLQREVDANRDLYQSTLQKIREASVVAALRASNVRVVDRAKAPMTPYQPSLPINMGIALLAGGMFSVLFVLIRERSDQSIRAPGESTRLLQVPELAIIPSARRDIRTQIVSGSSNGRESDRLLLQGANGNGQTNVVTDWQKSGSLVAESFRSAVTSILLWGRDRALSHKVLVITSAHPNAGKTTSVLNLGLALAESGRRVLLIDGDLRLPQLGKIFGLEQAAGLGEVLAEQMPPAIAKDLIRATGLPNLFVLPSGSRQPNVTQILHSTILERLLEQIKPDYDFILIDSPPAIPLADARLLARHSDGVILVFRAGETSAEQSLAVRKCFWQDGTHIFGSILNDWNAHTEDPSYVNSYLKYARSSTDRQ
jgi:polysaccharide biosynthesis transport protein